MFTKRASGSIAAASILAAGTLWGTMGVFRRALGELGLSTTGVILIRCGIAALCYAAVMLFTDPQQFRVRLKDAWCFLGSGLCSLLFFTLCYFQAMTLMSLSAAAILLYTAPCFVILLSALLFGDRITPRILLSMVLAFAGCCLVSGVVGSENRLSLIGVLYGLGSGIGYALYSIFGKLAMARGYKSLTINFYSCLLAAIGAALLCSPCHEVSLIAVSADGILWALSTGFVTCFLPYLLYTYGLSFVEAGRASIMASIEPVVATLFGLLVYHEAPDLWSFLGIVLVLSAIVLTNTKAKQQAA